MSTVQVEALQDEEARQGLLNDREFRLWMCRVDFRFTDAIRAAIRGYAAVSVADGSDPMTAPELVETLTEWVEWVVGHTDLVTGEPIPFGDRR